MDDDEMYVYAKEIRAPGGWCWCFMLPSLGAALYLVVWRLLTVCLLAW